MGKQVTPGLTLLVLLLLLVSAEVRATVFWGCPQDCVCNLHRRHPAPPNIECVLRTLRPFFFEKVRQLHLYKEVVVRGVAMEALPRDTFVGMYNVSKLTIKDSRFDFFEDNALAGVGPALSDLRFERTRLSYLKSGTLSNITSISNIVFDHSYVRDLGTAAFSTGYPGNVCKVRDLIIENSNITRLHTEAFTTIFGLQNLLLRRNHILAVSGDAFKMAAPVDTVTILDNVVMVLETGSFHTLTAKRTVIFGNAIKNVDRFVFGDLVTASKQPGKTVTFQSNNLTCDCRLLWLYEEDPQRTVVLPDWNRCEAPARFRGNLLSRVDISRICPTAYSIIGGSDTSRMINYILLQAAFTVTFLTNF